MAVAMANFAGERYAGRSVAYDHTGALAAGPAAAGEKTVLARFDLAALRATRAAERSRLAARAFPRLCEPTRRPEYQRQNVFGRVGGSVI